jgi:hypothetical protein
MYFQTAQPMLEYFQLPDHKLWYWAAGVFSSLTIFMERKSRRSELALYAFPRAADALYLALIDRKLVSGLPQGEMLMFSLSVSQYLFLGRALFCTSPTRIISSYPVFRPPAAIILISYFISDDNTID